MNALAAIEDEVDRLALADDGAEVAMQLLGVAERVLECWVAARGDVPTTATSEGFRLLALHRQGAQNAPSFNACRETCREIVYHYNLLTAEPAGDRSARRQRMMAMLVRHLALFVGGKMQVEKLGEFCCASRPLRERA